MVLCVLSTLKESNSGLVCCYGDKCVPLCDIIDQFTGNNCTSLFGKPKLFFFLDKGTKQDSAVTTTTEIHVCGGYCTRVQYLLISYIQGKLQFNNSHSGVCAFVGTGSGTSDSLIESLESVLQLEDLRNGKVGLQTALVNLIRNVKIKQEDNNIIRPQLISTLPFFVDFPSLLSPAKPTLMKRRKIIIAAGINIESKTTFYLFRTLIFQEYVQSSLQ